MTIKIKLSDSVIEAFRNSDRELFEEISDEEIRYGITAALEAMVECGMARVAFGEIDLDEYGDTWFANEKWETGDFPALIIRLDGGKK